MSGKAQARPFRVGDKVVSKHFGKGVVTDISKEIGEDFPVEVSFSSQLQYYTLSGRWAWSMPSHFDIQHAEPEPEKI